MLGSWLARLRPSFRTHEEIYADAEANRQFDLQYLIMMVLACLIALFGLLLNSPAVIIGAMLISPLMGPILSCGLAMTLADGNIGKKAAFNTVASVIEVVLIAALATALIPLKDATPEILARTNPNLMDLLVAFFSGVAGTLALCSARGGLTILPGVAIATAVMPPLATTGYGISTGQWHIAAGAFMLFFTNLTAIIISADIVFLAVGFRPQQDTKASRHRLLLRYRVAAAVLILGVLSVPLLQTLTRAVMQARLRKDVRAVIAERLEREGQTRLSNYALSFTPEGPLRLDVTVRTTRVLPAAKVREFERSVEARVGRPVRVELQQVQLATNELDRISSNYLAGGTVQADKTATSAAALAPETALGLVKVEMEAVAAPLRLTDIRITGLRIELEAVTVRFESTAAAVTQPQAWSVVAAGVQQRLKSRVRLDGKLEITGLPPLEVAPRFTAAERRRVRVYLAQLTEQGLTAHLRVPSAGADASPLLQAFPFLQVHPADGLVTLTLVPVQNVQAACCDEPAAP